MAQPKDNVVNARLDASRQFAILFGRLDGQTNVHHGRIPVIDMYVNNNETRVQAGPGDEKSLARPQAQSVRVKTSFRVYPQFNPLYRP
jgi:hypothetical protein